MAVRSGKFSDSCFNTLAEGTVRGTISNVVQTCWSLGRQNPTKDADNKLSILLSRQFRAFRNDDPKEKQQKALPFAVLDELVKHQVTETDKSITQLTIGKAFFACRSCEYSKVPRREQKCTRLLCLRNVRFFRDGLLMPTQSDNLESADRMQENNLKNDTVIHGRIDDSVLCLVLQRARLVNRIWTYPGSSLDTPVCTVWRNGRMEHITSKSIIQPLRLTCSSSYVSACLGFEPHKVGTHSLRSGAAMEMYLEKFPSTPSCSSAGGQAMLFFTAFVNRWSNSRAISRRRC